MTKLRRDKEVKVSARRKEVSKRGPGHMNQEETAKAPEEDKRMQSLLKDMMKKKALEKASGDKGGQQKEQPQICKKTKAGKKREQNKKEKNNEKESKTKKAATGIKKNSRP